LVLTACVLAPAVAFAQAPWTVTVTPTLNPLAIGFCGAVQLTVFDASGKEVPRNPLGFRVTMADFDVTVTAPGASVAGQQIDTTHFSVCGCQGGAAGTVATVTATYPAQALAAAARVPGIAFQKTATLVLSEVKGPVNPPACLIAAPAVAASPTGAAAPAPRPPPPSGVLTPLPPGFPTTVPAPAPPTPPVATVSPTTAPPVTLTPAPASTPAAVAPPVAPPLMGTPMLAPPTTSTGTAPSPAPAAAPLPLPTTSGRVPAAAPPAPTALVPINPAGFAAVQTGPGQVQLSWQPVSGASYYVLLGPGLPGGGAKVSGATTFMATAVPSGSQEWAVASYYDPGPVSTAAAAFPRVTLNVTAPIVSGTAPPIVPTTSRYRVVATGFRVVKETYDDQFDRDGLRNEVYAAFSMFHFQSGSEYQLLDRDLRRTQVHGDVLRFPGRVRAGSASTTGGLRTGDAFPSDPTIRIGALSDQSFPFSVWEGSLTDETDFAIIYPTLWESSGSEASYDDWFANLLFNAPAMWSGVKESLGASTITSFASAGPTGPVRSAVDAKLASMATGIAGLYSGLLEFSPRDRPIGLVGGRLPGDGLLLTRRGIEGSLTGVGAGSSRISLSIPFVDDPVWPKLLGSYILYLQVERMP
jgi:hypothetical protein